MDKAKIKEFYTKVENWLNQHTHHERIFILIAGWIIIYLLWYMMFEKSVLQAIDQHNASITTQTKEYLVFQNEILQLHANAKSIATQKSNDAKQLTNNIETKVPLASQKDNDIIIQTILTPQENVHFLRLDNATPTPGVGSKAPAKSDVQLSFSSDYFGTINYLSQLEKLPWCLSWDSLEYKVAKYPDAVVVINLHIVNS